MAASSPWLKSIANTSLKHTSTPPLDSSSRNTALSYRRPASSSSRKGPAKYPLVSDLAEFIENGLKSLDYTTLSTSTDLPVARLEIFREAFTKFIDEFNIYRPFLLDIKREYDAVIEALWEKYNDTLHIRSHLASEEKAHALANLEQENAHRQCIDELKTEITRLEVKLEAKSKECTTCAEECSRLRSQSRATASENEELRQSCTLLTKSLVRMEEERKQLMVKDATRATEVVAATVNTQRAVDEAERLRQTISDMEAEHSTFVSPEIFERQSETLETLQQETRLLEQTHKKLIVRYTTLKAALEQAAKKTVNTDDRVDTRSSSITSEIPSSLSLRLSRALSPSKNQSQQGQFAEPVDNSDAALTRNLQDSRALIEVLLDQVEGLKAQVRQHQVEAGQLLTGAANTNSVMKDDGNEMVGEFMSPWNHFHGLGNSDAVPLYLRATGKVQNLCLSKRDVARLIDECWAFVRLERSKENAHEVKAVHEREMARQAAALDPLVVAMTTLLDDPSINSSSSLVVSNDTSASTPTPPPLSEEMFKPFPVLFAMFLESKCKSRVLSIELAYNIVDALKKYNNNCDFKLFLAILHEDISEDCWAEQSKMLQTVKDELVREQQLRAVSSDNVRKIAPENFLRALKKCNPTKPEHAFSRLQKVLVMSTKGSREVDFVDLLLDAETGFKGKFCDLLCQQFTNECINFTRRVIGCVDQQKDGLSSHSSEGGARSSALASVAKIRSAIEVADPNKGRNEINRILSRGCALSVEEVLLAEAKATEVNVDEFNMRLRRKGVLRMSGGKTRGEA